MEELWTMSKKELDRAGVLVRVVERRLSQEKAATLLGVSTRQLRRLLRAYQAQGASALVSKRRGKPSNRRFDHGFKERVLGLVRERYADFGLRPHLGPREATRRARRRRLRSDAVQVDGRRRFVARPQRAPPCAAAPPAPRSLRRADPNRWQRPCANTPAAKGRVERAHLTLQDRLVKEMRLAAISSMEDGNLFLEGFRDRHNERFGRAARETEDMHRPLLVEHKLDDIFQEHREAKVSKNLTLHLKRTMYVLDNCPANRTIAGKRVQVFEDEGGQVTIRFQGRALRYRAFPKHGGAGVTPGDIVANKHLAGALTMIREQQQLREAQRVAKLRTLRERAIAARA